jgi:tetratricopeptide (TPR) repeat protein
MKPVFLLCIGLALCSVGLANVWVAGDPGDGFLEAYFLIQDGDAAEHQADWAKADAKFSAALSILSQIRQQTPDWNPHITDFRTRYCNQHLASIKPKLVAAQPGVLPETQPTIAEPAQPPETPTAATPEARQLQQISDELQRARAEVQQLQQERNTLRAQLESELHKPAPTGSSEAQKTLEQLRAMQAAQEATAAKLRDAEAKAAQGESLRTQLQVAQTKIQQLESSRDELNGKLQQAIASTSATRPAAEVEELLKKNAELTAQIAELRERAAPTSAPDEEKIQLRADLAQVQQQLDQLRSENVRARQEVGELRAANVRLGSSEKELIGKLTEADRQLRSATAAHEKGDEIILQLRKENALLREIVDKRLAAEQPEPKGKNRAKAVVNAPPAERPPIAAQKPGREQLVATLKAPEPPAKHKAPADETILVISPSSGASPTKPSRKLAKESGASPLTRNLLNEAREAFALKDYDAALEKYNFVLANEPNNLTALSNVGVIRYQQNRLDDAEEMLRKAIVIAPSDSPSRSLLGVVYFRLGKIEEAFNELTRAVALDPRNAEAHNYLGITLSEKGWGAAAEQEIRRAIELNPQYADAHFNLAVIYSRQKTPRYELSRHHYQKALDLGGEHDPQLEALLKQHSNKASMPTEQPKIETAQP